MNAKDVLAAIQSHHSDAAIVHEIQLNDHDWLDRHEAGSKPVRSRRIDALMFKSLERTAIEAKVTKADFEADVWAKRAPWLRVSHRFIYAVPAGLIQYPHHGCGLWWIHDDGRVEVKKKATINRTPEPLPQHVVQALAYRAQKEGSK